MKSGEHVLTTGGKKFYLMYIGYRYIVLKMIISIGLVYIYYLYALKATLKFSFNPKSEERVEASGVYNFC